ncbi:hypothetical protein [Streptomyces sp. NPDC088789]|uniref:hypothetical protein n=1 Tax=Streptomyces sp. NPDC088789 TaxID=3365899 RepID=UPI00380EAB80
MSPRKGQPHDHAFDTDTLQEKANRIRREQGLPPEAEESPRPCHWYDDGHGGRFLIPGCAARAQDPDSTTACTCPVLAGQLAVARSDIERLTSELHGARTWHAHVSLAVDAHPDGRKIMKAAADRAETAR